jgi:transposase
MERPGVYWRPIYTLLEGLFTLFVVNAQPMKAVPGRKTDVKDAEGMADLLRHGLLRASFIPAKPPRQRRELTRHRPTLVQDRARVIKRVQTVWEEAHITRASVVTDIRGVSARAMLAALIAGERDGAALAALARGRLRAKRGQLVEALQGYVTPHHRVLRTEDRSQIDDLDDAIDRARAVLTRHLAAEHEAMTLLDSIPGVSQRPAEILLADIGPDMTRFPSATPLASWAGMCPGHYDSGGKRLSGKTRKGRRWLRQTLVEVAPGASKMRQPSRAAPYRRIAARRGKKRALMAVGHTILRLV